MRKTTTRNRRARKLTIAGVKSLVARITRKAPNHNLHVITPHGKVQAGRKGRNS